MGIGEALKKVQDRINISAGKSGRRPDEIKLVAVSKSVELLRIIEGIKAGITILGENRVQEARDKIKELRTQNPDLKPQWHLVGHLQKNKAKTAVQLFDLIHSLDSLSLAEELNKQSQRIGKRQRVLLQVKLSNEATKHGILVEDLIELLEKVSGMDYLKLEGLMTMPPFLEEPEKTRIYFRRLRELADKAIEKGFSIKELSMGMSNDFEIAIEEGATMVRIGTAIFGDRAQSFKGNV